MSTDLSTSPASTTLSAPRPRTGLVLTALMLAAFLAILNETVLSIALPQLMVDFSITAATAQWFTTGFLLTMAVVIPTTGFLLQRLSRRTLFIVAVVTFLMGTALAAVATGFAMMLVARVVQAIGTAIILPLLMSTTLMLVATERRGVMLGMNQVVIAVGPALGPTLAGVVMHALSWQWISLLMLPLGLAILIFGAIVVRVPGGSGAGALDMLSVVLSALGFGGLVYALAGIQAIVAGDLVTILAAVVGAIALVAFAWRQRKLAASGREPLLNLQPFTVPVFRRSVWVIAFSFGTMLGMVVVLPIYLQDGRELDVLVAGLLLLPSGVLQAIVSPLFGAVFDKYGAAPLLIPGAVLMTAGAWLLASTDVATPLALVVVFQLVFMLGLGGVMTSLMTGSLGALPPQLYGHGSAIVSTVQQLAGAAGTALLVAGLSIGAAGVVPASAGVVAGSRVAFAVAGVVTLIGLIVACTIRIRPVRH
ncbi:DHA2 family efflux MFS transporter permease subunit [Microbacterium gorillae]|uniref:DHA2 family efflux MFS transporter permease subunit n=1 Tax=Microbacterium gorillae TaxID=1231063 RepID=UPI00058E950F|nr:DHA2 family efflux MFS transporter permease subunit [Microbacterium gorillae]